MKRIITIQDLSCVGKCSIGVALPVLSAMGIECAMLPTQLLSAHTAFEGFYCQDLRPHFAPIVSHWKQLGLRFDAIYTGYLGTAAQADLAEACLADFPCSLVFIDPVMADSGRLYAGICPSFPARMRELVCRAHVITPNVTEACLLTGMAYQPQQDESYIRTLLEKLLTLGAETVILTGLQTDTRHMGVAAMNQAGRLALHFTDRVEATFHGSGDLFAATCVGAMTRGLSADQAIALAADYVFQTILVTHRNPDASWYGVDFETTLPDLIRRTESLFESEALQ